MTRVRRFRLLIYLATGGLVVALGLWVMGATGSSREQISTVEAVVRDILAPLQSGVQVISRGMAGIDDFFASRSKLKHENEELKARIAELERELGELKEYRAEVYRLRNLLGIAGGEGQAQYVAAPVLACSPSNWYESIIIGAGRDKGIGPGMAVVSEWGLVGRVRNVSQHTSEVITILDSQAPVAAMLQENRVAGVVQGTADKSGMLEMVYLPYGLKVLEGQTVYTSGLGSIYPKGLRIGYVSKVTMGPSGLMQKAYVKPFVDFSRLEEVLVITSPGVANR